MKLLFIQELLQTVTILLSISEVNVYDEKSCITDIEKVSSCPVTEQEYKSAAQRKGCFFVKFACTNSMVKLKYHCLPNAWGNKLLEMCATDTVIIGHTCAEYNERGKLIQPNFQRKCDGSDFYPKCQFKYMSSKTYLYPGCFILPKKATTTSSKNEISTTSHIVPEDDNNQESLPFVIGFPVLIFLVVLIVSVCLWKYFKGNNNNDAPSDRVRDTRPTAEEVVTLHVEPIKVKTDEENNFSRNLLKTDV